MKVHYTQVNLGEILAQFGTCSSAQSAGFGTCSSAQSAGFGTSSSAQSARFGTSSSAQSAGFGTSSSAQSAGFGYFAENQWITNFQPCLTWLDQLTDRDLCRFFHGVETSKIFNKILSDGPLEIIQRFIQIKLMNRETVWSPVNSHHPEFFAYITQGKNYISPHLFHQWIRRDRALISISEWWTDSATYFSRLPPYPYLDLIKCYLAHLTPTISLDDQISTLDLQYYLKYLGTVDPLSLSDRNLTLYFSFASLSPTRQFLLTTMLQQSEEVIVRVLECYFAGTSASLYYLPLGCEIANQPLFEYLVVKQPGYASFIPEVKVRYWRWVEKILRQLARNWKNPSSYCSRLPQDILRYLLTPYLDNRTR